MLVRMWKQIGQSTDKSVRALHCLHISIATMSLFAPSDINFRFARYPGVARKRTRKKHLGIQ
jgi:hypothetical protein